MEDSDPDPDSFDPSSPEEREIGAEAAEESSEFFGLMGHFYRGELGRATAWRSRLDRTTNWAVVVTATLLTWGFSSPDNPHYVLLGGVVAVLVFLVVEARRYRTYDVWRSRVRMLEENVFANAIDPEGVENERWRTLLSDDLREPAAKIPFVEALSRRLRRVYLPILTLLVGSWALRVTAFTPENVSALESASVSRVPGTAVVLGVLGVYSAAVALALWPMPRHAKGKIRDSRDADDWRD
ncbi:MAG: DUF2270 domain-containing protein [Halobacteria archaeon]|nr:DUF2270 domain-containing protein [Halobacteria archaeon]